MVMVVVVRDYASKMLNKGVVCNYNVLALVGNSGTMATIQ